MKCLKISGIILVVLFSILRIVPNADAETNQNDPSMQVKTEEIKLSPVLNAKQFLFPNQPALEYRGGHLSIPVRTRRSVPNFPGMVCKDYNPIYANFTFLEDRESHFYSIYSIQCQIDPSKVVMRQSFEDINDSAYECFANVRYCDAMWVESSTRQIWFLKFPE